MADKTITLDAVCNDTRLTDPVKPRVSILDRRFVYVPSGSTDIAKTFARLRQEQSAVNPMHRLMLTRVKERA